LTAVKIEVKILEISMCKPKDYRVT